MLFFHLQWSVALGMGVAILLNFLVPLAAHSVPLVLLLRIIIGVCEAVFFPALTQSKHMVVCFLFFLIEENDTCTRVVFLYLVLPAAHSVPLVLLLPIIIGVCEGVFFSTLTQYVHLSVYF